MFEVIAAHIVVDAMQAQFSDGRTDCGKGRRQSVWRVDLVGRLRSLIARYRHDHRRTVGRVRGAY